MQNIIGNFTIQHFQETGSCNDLSFELIKNNQAFNKHLIITDKQLAGRGRYDRKWLSFPGNLYFSTIITVKDLDNIYNYSLLTACILGSTLEKFQIKTKYKWPNDIIFCDRKLAGILLQMQNINKINYLIIGIGLNLKDAPDYAISLKEFNISREDFLEEFTKIFDQYLTKYQEFGFLPIKNEWKKNSYKIGEEIKLSNDKEGIFTDIDDDGNLLLKNDAGKIDKILSEEVFV